MANRPRVLAHRGASETYPEHTLAAYRAALEAGADGFECDVRLTVDGHLVCVHDRRIDRTSNGRGVLSRMTLAELDALDWGSWKNPAAPTPSRLLTLDQLLTLVADAGRPIELAIETKHPARYGGLVERRLVETLNRFGSDAPVRVMSFSRMSLRRLRILAPSLPTVLLMGRVPPRLRDGSLPPGVSTAGPSIEVVGNDPDYVAKVRRRGHQVYVWTVNTEQAVRDCEAAGVDAVITDRPDMALRVLDRAL